MKIGEMDLGDLVSNLTNLTLQEPQAKRTGFSTHDPQWTRWPNEATIKSPDLKRAFRDQFRNLRSTFDFGLYVQ